MTFARNTFGLDFVILPQGAKHVYCANLPAPTTRLTFSTNDRSGINLCANIRLRIIPMMGGVAIQKSEAGGDQTIRYFGTSTAKIPAGQYLVEVEDLPGNESCLSQKYLINWQFYNN